LYGKGKRGEKARKKTSRKGKKFKTHLPAVQLKRKKKMLKLSLIPIASALARNHLVSVSRFLKIFHPAKVTLFHFINSDLTILSLSYITFRLVHHQW
jgi:hypothetical protein